MGRHPNILMLPLQCGFQLGFASLWCLRGRSLGLIDLKMNQGELYWSQKQFTHQFLEMFNTPCHNPMTSFLPMNFRPTIAIVLVDHTSGRLLCGDRDEQSVAQKGRLSLRRCGKRWWRWNDIMPMMRSKRKNEFTIWLWALVDNWTAQLTFSWRCQILDQSP